MIIVLSDIALDFYSCNDTDFFRPVDFYLPKTDDFYLPKIDDAKLPFTFVLFFAAKIAQNINYTDDFEKFYHSLFQIVIKRGFEI